MKHRLSLAAACVLLAAEAQAQTTAVRTESSFFRGRNISVREREKPGYDPLGLRMGSFVAFPQLSLASEYDSNVFAEERGGRDDVVFQIEPQLTVASRWARNALSAYARVARRQFLTYEDESSTDWQTGVQGAVGAGRTRLTAGADYGRFTEPRTATNTSRTARRRIRFNEASGFIEAIHEISRFRLRGRADVRAYDFSNAQDAAGGISLEDDRSRNILIFTGRADYAFTPAAAVYVSGSYNRRNYDLAPPSVGTNRDSDGLELFGGLDFDLTALVRGQVQLGYFRQDYKAALLGRTTGLAALGRVEWFPSQLTTVTITGVRRIEDSGQEETPVYVSTSIGVEADHELLRNLILSAGAELVDDDYRGADRRDRRYVLSAGAEYRMNRTIGVRARYSYLDQNSKGTEREGAFAVHRFLVSLVLRR